jgi:hypothetical protein
MWKIAFSLAQESNTPSQSGRIDLKLIPTLCAGHILQFPINPKSIVREVKHTQNIQSQEDPDF